MPNAKRVRPEDLNQLDDSMQPLLLEFKARENRGIEDLCSFMASYIEKSEEFRRTVYELHHQHKALVKRVDNVETHLKAYDDKQQENGVQLELFERDVKDIR
jgi:hypothetical protein